MARIGIDFTAAIHQQAGIGRYVRELVGALGKIAASDPTPSPSPNKGRGTRGMGGEGETSDDLSLFVAGAAGRLPPAPNGCRYAPSILSERAHARLWHRLRLPIPIELWTGGLDLFHATDFALPPTRARTRTALTVHDLAFERYPSDTMPGMLAHLRRVVPRSARRADCVIAVSEATRQDLVDLYGIEPEKITMIPHGVEERFSLTPNPSPGGRGETAGRNVVIGNGEGEKRAAQRERALRAKYHLQDGPFVLTVGTLQPRKNHARLIQAFGRIKSEARLVIAGGMGWGYQPALAEVARLKLEDRVTVAGQVDDDDLPDLYRAASAFAYPALYEGFGLPALEAMACGAPVVASSASSLPEVVGDAGLLVDPLDVDALAGALQRLLDDSALRADLIQKGLARAREFTWERTARLTWEVYRRLLVGDPSFRPL